MERPAFAGRAASADDGLSILVRSAVPLSERQREALRALCISRYGAPSSLSFEVDQATVGGIWIRVGDMVIDGSLAGRIEQLRHSLRERLHLAAGSDRPAAS